VHFGRAILRSRFVALPSSCRFALHGADGRKFLVFPMRGLVNGRGPNWASPFIPRGKSPAGVSGVTNSELSDFCALAPVILQFVLLRWLALNSKRFSASSGSLWGAEWAGLIARGHTGAD